jgi:16S rRNA (guanine1207-N2)-methyltransferase
VTGQFFEDNPAVASNPIEFSTRIWGRDLTFSTDTGVFARGRIDLGTSVLFRATEPPGVGRLLDLGCGYGAIACALAAASPDARVVAIDVNNRALALTAANARRNGLSSIQVLRPEEVADDLVFDEIWSNPPIHAGKQALHELLLRWLPRLSPDGRAHLVVGRNLGADPLARWLQEQGFGCSRLGSAKGFRVLRVAPAEVTAP